MKHVNFSFRLIPIYGLVFLLVILITLMGNKAVQAVSETALIKRTHTIIIDAGHGGEDGGALSCTGVPESAINLEIALRLNDLMQFLGFQTKMIRTEDISVYTEGESISQKKISDLKARVRICNETEGAVLLSIHQNTFTDSRYSGAQVFYPATAGSMDFATDLQAALIRTVNPGSKRAAKKAQGIYLMEHVQCPAILLECGFLSSVEEEARLRSHSYQNKLCCVIASTTARFVLDAQTND